MKKLRFTRKDLRIVINEWVRHNLMPDDLIDQLISMHKIDLDQYDEVYGYLLGGTFHNQPKGKQRKAWWWVTKLFERLNKESTASETGVRPDGWRLKA